MLGVEGYGSDNDSDIDDVQQSVAPAAPPKAAVASKKSTGLSLPAPSASSSSTTKSSGLTLPAPKKKKKITIGLPTPSSSAGAADDEEDRRPVKKARLEAGAGASGLLSMLPAPKNKNANPMPPPASHERVLGGGRGPGLVFHTKSSVPSGSSSADKKATVEDAEDDDDDVDGSGGNAPPFSASILEEVEETKTSTAPALPFMPASLARGRANISTEDKPSLPKSATARAAGAAINAAPAVDFFSLGSSSSSAPKPRSIPSAPSPSRPVSIPSIPTSISAAPSIEEFTPPEPTQTDPYPGYYQLPSGGWAAYDPAYYNTFYTKWQKEYDAQVRALEKGTKGFEGYDHEVAAEVNAAAEMERAREEVQVQEERKALTGANQNEGAAPKMNIKGAALSGRARGRHQLTTLLTEAYANREALEERIAQGRRNRKEAGNKYGF